MHHFSIFIMVCASPDPQFLPALPKIMQHQEKIIEVHIYPYVTGSDGLKHFAKFPNLHPAFFRMIRHK